MAGKSKAQKRRKAKRKTYLASVEYSDNGVYGVVYKALMRLAKSECSGHGYCLITGTEDASWVFKTRAAAEAFAKNAKRNKKVLSTTVYTEEES